MTPRGVAEAANRVEGNEVLCLDKARWPLKYEEAGRLIEIYTSGQSKSNANTERITDSDKFV